MNISIGTNYLGYKIEFWLTTDCRGKRVDKCKKGLLLDQMTSSLLGGRPAFSTGLIKARALINQFSVYYLLMGVGWLILSLSIILLLSDVKRPGARVQRTKNKLKLQYFVNFLHFLLVNLKRYTLRGHEEWMAEENWQLTLKNSRHFGSEVLWDI